MEITMEKVKAIPTHEVKSLVRAYLLARAHAETIRSQVDEVYLDILTKVPVYADLNGREGTRQILKETDLYLSTDEELVKETWQEADRVLRLKKIKPEDMDEEKCPALVAEHDLVKIGWALIKAAGEPIGIDNDSLVGVGKRQEFIDLTVGLIVNLPDFKHPMGPGFPAAI